MNRLREFVHHYFPNDTCKIDMTIKFATMCLGICGFDYISEDRPKSYIFYSLAFIMFNNLVTFTGYNSFLMSKTLDLKINCFTTFCVGSMVSISVVKVSLDTLITSKSEVQLDENYAILNYINKIAFSLVLKVF